MPGTARLSWSSGTERLQEDLDWVILRQALEQTHDKYLQRQQQQQDVGRGQFLAVQNKFGQRLHDVISTLPFIDDPLRELELSGVVDDCKRLTSIQPFLPFLTNLKLQWRKTSTFHMDQLLLSFLKNARLLQTSLEDLLPQTQQLHELRLINLLRNEWLYWPFFSDVSYSWNDLHRCLQRVPHNLSSFHFSVQDQTMPDSDLKAMIFDVCPQSTEWTFRAKDLTPTLTRYLSELANVVTSLELYWPERVHSSLDSGLHAYLCASPHLVHLKASSIALLFDHLDVHHRGDSYYSRLYSQDHCLSSTNHANNNHNDDPIATGPLRVWKCRNLRTLHLAFHNHGLSLLTSPVHSRVLFGYISRVCPQLRDLEIHIPEQTRWAHDQHFPNLDMRLQGGLCLLTRLKHLESLRLGRVQQCMTFDPVHLNWMVASGHSAKYKEERRKIAASWDECILKETRQVDRGTERTQINCSSKNMEGVAGDQLEHDLKHLGLVLDVKEMVDEMDSTDYRCLPVLQRVSIFNDHGIGLRPADELMRLFPPKSFKLFR
ncbi:hypothetical protein BGZ97_003396 [Linnemannia gamsii]|uniref:Uncharacterized protein n=1 Tax=Linnemannia gamsii TaxID=64522 RepID=A0A9P6RNY8_9FUNG|nr:hypothetical protein BGZ97_003396 [Linnemannia gamsii]